MAATAAQVLQVRRMTGLVESTAYSDAEIAGKIEAYPILDELGSEPYEWDMSTDPPSQDANEDWIPTYDLNAAAADVWEERAAGLAGDFDFDADGASYKRSQAYENYMKQCRFYRARRVPKTMTAVQWPKENEAVRQPSWIGNLPEADEG